MLLITSPLILTPEDVQPIRTLLAENGVDSQPFYPMIRGRVSSVNGESASDRDKRLQHRGQEGAWVELRQKSDLVRSAT